MAQCFQHRASFEDDPINIADDTNFLRGQLLQVTFAPVWVQFQSLNAPDPVETSSARLRPAADARDDGPTQGHGARASATAKRAYDEAFGLVECAAPCSILGAAPPAKRCEIKWNLVRSDTPARAALPLAGAAPTAAPGQTTAVLATGAASSLREIAPLPLSRAIPAAPAILPVETAASSEAAAVSERSAAAAGTLSIPGATLAATSGRAAENRPAPGPLTKALVAQESAALAGATEGTAAPARTVASLSTLSSAMSLLTPEGPARAPTTDRPVKRVMNKAPPRKNATSPPAASPRSPA